MKVAIIGAGFTGLSAAYDLARIGHEVVVYERAPQVGGLASGFRVSGWDWMLERFYHHIFASDSVIIKLVAEIGASDLLFFRRPITAYWCKNHGAHAFDSALSLLRYPHLPFRDRLRVGVVLALLRNRRDWQRLERTTADAWLRTRMGVRAYSELLQPLLSAKFGKHYRDVNMAWLWARINARTAKLGYFKGGLCALAERLASRVREGGGQIRLSSQVQLIKLAGHGATLVSSEGRESYDNVVVTTSPALLGQLVPDLPAAYAERLRELRSLGALALVLALTKELTGDVYWMNFRTRRFPFVTMVEHTNLVEPEHYGGQHLLYLGNYLEPNDELFQLSTDELLKLCVPALREMNPSFVEEWVQGAWVHREVYAQPVVGVNASARIPPLRTPLRCLYWAGMSQVYPWDRGTNYAVEVGRRVARELTSDHQR